MSASSGSVWRRRLVVFSAVFLALVFAAGAAVVLHLRASLPRLSGELAFSKLNRPVVIERDRDGVPTFTAESEADLAFALGFVHAQERFFQMDLARRAGVGELAALFGPPALPVDRARRVHRFRARARATFERLPEARKTQLTAYAAGVQAGMDDLGALPYEYVILGATPEPWRPEDAFCVAYSMFFVLQDSSGQAELRRSAIERALPAGLAALALSPGSRWDAAIDKSVLPLPPIPALADDPRPESTPSEEPESEPVPGSNNWAVSGRVATHGGAMVANDMHLSLRMPNIWFRARLRVTGDDGYEATGVTLPGAPLMVAGSNGSIAWGFTNAYIDTSDLVSLEPGETADTYKTPDGSRPFERHVEQIEVNGAASEPLTVLDTIWGPVLGRDLTGRQVALRWIAHEPNGNNVGLANMVQAETIEDAIAVAHGSGMANQNVMIAAKDGRIAWTLSGLIPLRPEGCEGARPVSWADGRCVWLGFASSTEVPRVIEPPDGRLWTANNRIIGPDLRGPVRYRNPAVGARAAQIRDGLFAKPKLSEADLLAVALDDRAGFLAPWRELMLPRLEGELKNAVENWGGRATPASIGYRVVRSFRGAVLKRLVDPSLAPARALLDGAKDADVRRLRPRNIEHFAWTLLQTRPAHLLPKAFDSWDALLDAAIGDVRARIKKEAGGELSRFTWGAANTLAIRHPLSAFVPFLGKLIDPPRVPVAGDDHMPRVQRPSSGASERFVVSPGKEAQGIFHMPGGQASHPLSPYLHAGHDAWVTGEATPFLPGPTEWTLRLTPGTD